MKKIIKNITIIALALCTFTSCVNDLDVKSIDPNTTSELDVNALFVKIYATLGLTGQKGPDGSGDVWGVDEGTSAFYRMMYSLNEFPSDLIYWIWPDVGVDDVRKASWNANNALVKGLYSRLYFDITLCNLFLDKTDGLTDSDVLAKRAEVRFIRALNYYYLLDMFGNVPLADVENIRNNETPSQVTRKQLYDWMITELTEIEPEMSEAGNRKAYYRVDKAAAWLLLSRIYLNAEVYTGTADFDNAALYAKKVIDSSYELASQYRYLFMGDNDLRSSVNDAWKEIILPIAQDGLEMQSWGGSLFLIASTRTPGVETWGCTESWKCIRSRRELVWLFLPASKAKKYAIDGGGDGGYTTENTNLMKQIEKLPYAGGTDSMIVWAKDDRAMLLNFNVYEDAGNQAVLICNLSTKNKADEFLSGWSITKFTNEYADKSKSPTDNKFTDMDIPFMRKAEAYLNYAEAVLRGAATIDGLTSDEAVNIIRRRAHAVEKTNVELKDILDERGREFYAEGYRRSDLIRFGEFGNLKSNYYWEYKGSNDLAGKNFDEYRNLYPIPLAEITASGKLTQNPGY